MGAQQTLWPAFAHSLPRPLPMLPVPMIPMFIVASRDNYRDLLLKVVYRVHERSASGSYPIAIPILQQLGRGNCERFPRENDQGSLEEVVLAGIANSCMPRANAKLTVD